MGYYDTLWGIAKDGHVSKRVADEDDFLSNINTIDEAVEYLTSGEYIQQSLTEAYYGRTAVEPIAVAMKKVEEAVRNDPYHWLRISKANDELQKAICKVFGFKCCIVHWMDPSKYGNCTKPTAFVFNWKGKVSVNKGWTPKGYYDMDNVLTVVIELDQKCFTKQGRTADEMVACLLHEIGHNFDISNWIIARTVFAFAFQIVDCISNMSRIEKLPFEDAWKKKVQMKLASATAKNIVIDTIKTTSVGRIVMGEIDALWTSIIHILPDPVKKVILKVCHTFDDVMVFINSIIMAVPNMLSIASDIASKITATIINPALMIPIHLVNSGFKFLTSKGEQFADSFATSYGYGAEFISGLEKSDRYYAGGTVMFGPITNAMHEISYSYTTILQAFDSHGSTVQRSVGNMRYLRSELNRAGLSAEEKALIETEIKRLEDVTEKLTKMSDSDKFAVSTALNGIIYDLVKGGKNLTPTNYVR